MNGDWIGGLQRAKAHAPHLAHGLGRLPILAALLGEGKAADALAFAKAAGASAETIDSALRREKQALALALAVGDLAGAFPLGTVVQELSAFADRALDAAIADAITHRVADAQPAGFIALALGKFF